MIQFVYLSFHIVPFVLLFMYSGSVSQVGTQSLYGLLHFPEPFAITYLDFCTCIYIHIHIHIYPSSVFWNEINTTMKYYLYFWYDIKTYFECTNPIGILTYTNKEQEESSASRNLATNANSRCLFWTNQLILTI